jgi:AcrR family transcriptional regulator
MASTIASKSSAPRKTSAPRKSRRRRRAEDAQREILDAAEQLLRQRPFRDVSLDDVMERTGMSRPSFYVYFRDRYELVVRVVERLDLELMAKVDHWLEGEGDPIANARVATEGVVEVWVEHGPVVRAIAEAAVDDGEVESIYTALVERFIGVIAAHLRVERRRGRLLRPMDVDQTARALVWMTERYLIDVLGREGERADLPAVCDTVHQIWVRALYPQ